MCLDTPETCRDRRNILRMNCASSWFFFTTLLTFTGGKKSHHYRALVFNKNISRAYLCTVSNGYTPWMLYGPPTPNLQVFPLHMLANNGFGSREQFFALFPFLSLNLLAEIRLCSKYHLSHERSESISCNNILPLSWRDSVILQRHIYKQVLEK